MRSLILISLIVLILGCSKDAEVVESSLNPNVAVETLFKHDGCTMYRFSDVGRQHYFAKCDRHTEVITTEKYLCGKSICARDSNIRTESK